MTKTATFHDLDGASVYITGGGSGIGASLTDGFLEQGANVAFVGRSDATEFCDEMEAKHGRRPHFMQCDITDVDRLHDTINEAADLHGPITALVNNAANDKRHSTEDVDSDFWGLDDGHQSQGLLLCLPSRFATDAKGRSWIDHQFLVHQLYDGQRGLPSLHNSEFRHQRDDTVVGT